VKNNEKTIEKALKSVVFLGGEIIIGDLGSTDGTLDICRKYQAKIHQISAGDGYHKARNKLIEKSDNEWHFFLEPWETLAYGAQEIKEPGAYYVKVIRNDIITKEIRLWKKGTHFSNPVHECIVDSHARELNVIIYSSPSTHGNHPLLIERWKVKSPAASEPYYYEACSLLAAGKYDEFILTAEKFLFRDNKKFMPVVMTRYYLAMVYCHIKKDPIAAVKQIIPCLIVKPLNAEFWCILGDIHFLSRKYKKAAIFYENAMILGSKRLKTDLWPMEIKKYKEYPLEMREKCEKILASSFDFTSIE
jgi:glycosyltransferase involved in cell wall biosynthesis